MPFQPENSTDKFATGSDASDQTANDVENEDAEKGTQFQEPDSNSEPALMLSTAQAQQAGMGDAMPGDKFQITVTVANQDDTGWNVSLDPMSAVKMPGPSADAPMPADRVGKNQTVKGPADLGMPTGLGLSPAILNT